MRTILIALLMSFATNAVADPFTVDGNAVLYDTINSEVTEEIDYGHSEKLLEILKTNENIELLILTSEGGFIKAGYDIADVVIDAELNTHVDSICESTCATVFLAGKKRSLELGAKIGFHSSYWAAEDIHEYYTSEKDRMGWETPFEFASWLYEDTQAEVFSDFEYLLERGVNAKFAIRTLNASSDSMWYPRRAELEAAGVLTEGP